MATIYRAKANGETEAQHFDIFAQNMADYFKQRDYLQQADYFTQDQNFVKEKLQKHLRNYRDFEEDRSNKQSEVLINQNGAYIGQDTKSQLKEDSLLSKFVSNNKLASSDENNDGFDQAQYFALASGLPTQKPLLFMQYPSARHGTDTSSFGKFPWSGGEKGPAKFYEPGSKVMVRWQIENSLKNGVWAIKLAESNPQNLSSYKSLTPTSIKVDADGYFQWGNPDGTSEGVEVLIPSSSSWVECTLQLVYKTQEFGEMYQCSDISTAIVETTNDWNQPCLNQGVWFKGECICTKGFFGTYWENKANSDMSAGNTMQTYKTIQPELTKSITKNKDNGIQYLTKTPEAEKLNLNQAQTAPAQEGSKIIQNLSKFVN